VFKSRPQFIVDDLPIFTGGIDCSKVYNLNVSGYTPTSDFFGKMIRKLSTMPEGACGLLMMSDNLWLYHKRQGLVKWVSLDGEKMESSHTK